MARGVTWPVASLTFTPSHTGTYAAVMVDLLMAQVPPPLNTTLAAAADVRRLDVAAIHEKTPPEPPQDGSPLLQLM